MQSTVERLFRGHGTFRATNRAGRELRKATVFSELQMHLYKEGSISGLVRGGESNRRGTDLPGAVFTEAVGVLEMIAKNPEERQHYKERLKAERDEWARTAQAKLDGLEIGELVGKIELLCKLLGQPYDGDRPLREQSIDQLAVIEAGLQRRLRDRT